MARRPIVDASVLLRLQQLAARTDRDLVSRLIDVFFEDSSARLSGMRDALGDEDPVRLAALAHGLAGSAGALGLADLAARCLALEASLSNSPQGDTARRVRDIERSFKTAAAALQSWRVSSSSPSSL